MLIRAEGYVVAEDDVLASLEAASADDWAAFNIEVSLLLLLLDAYTCIPGRTDRASQLANLAVLEAPLGSGESGVKSSSSDEFPWYYIAAAGAGGLLLVAAIVLVIILVRRRRKRAAPASFAYRGRHSIRNWLDEDHAVPIPFFLSLSLLSLSLSSLRCRCGETVPHGCRRRSRPRCTAPRAPRRRWSLTNSRR
jgi:hypothetical protein